MFKAWIALLVFAASNISIANEKELRSINLIVKTPFNTPIDSSLYLTGDGESLCHWKADCLRFRKIAPQLYKINLVSLIDLNF